MIDINAEYKGMTWDDVVGSNAAVLLKAWSDRIPQVVLFSGPYGCGKNLHAYLLAQELENAQIHVRNTVDNTAKGAEQLIIQFSAPPFVPNVNQVCILNEFTLFRKDAQAKFKDIFQAPPERTYFFICTNEPIKIIADINDRFMLKFHVDTLDEAYSFELVDKTCVRFGIELGKKKKLAIARGSKGRPRAIVLTIKALTEAGDATNALIAELLRQHTEPEGGKELMTLFYYGIGKRKLDATNARLKDLLDQSGDPESIRYTMLNMMYKGFHKGCSALYLTLLPPLEKGVEKHDLFIRFLKLFNRL